MCNTMIAMGTAGAQLLWKKTDCKGFNQGPPIESAEEKGLEITRPHSDFPALTTVYNTATHSI